MPVAQEAMGRFRRSGGLEEFYIGYEDRAWQTNVGSFGIIVQDGSDGKRFDSDTGRSVWVWNGSQWVSTLKQPVQVGLFHLPKGTVMQWNKIDADADAATAASIAGAAVGCIIS